MQHLGDFPIIADPLNLTLQIGPRGLFGDRDVSTTQTNGRGVTGRTDCTEAEIAADIFRARTQDFGEEGFRCTEARRRFLLIRGNVLLSRDELARDELAMRDVGFVQRVSNTLSSIFDRVVGDDGDGLGQIPRAAFALSALAVVLFILTRSRG